MESVCGWCLECHGGWCWNCHNYSGRIRLKHSFRLGFKASNNKAEYEVDLLGMGTWDIKIYSNSWLVVNQVQGSFKARDSWMQAYLQVVKQIMNKFCMTKVAQVGRAHNRHVDSLATLASSMTDEVPWLIKVELIREPSISVVNNVSTVGVDLAMILATKPCWMDPIIDFLAEDRVTDDEKEANKIRRVAAQY